MKPILISLALLLSAPAFAADPGAMTVSSLEGLCTMKPADGSGSSPLSEGDPLHEGETVQVPPGGRLEIAVANGTVIRLGENSRLLLGTAPPAGGRFSARLFVGSLWTKVHKLLASETFHVETENAVAGVRGTEFRVEAAGPGGSDDLVRVYEGAVEVKGPAGWAHSVTPGHELAFRRERPPAGPRAFDPASEKSSRLMAWVREKPPREGLVAPRERKAPERKDRKRERKERRQERTQQHRGLHAR